MTTPLTDPQLAALTPQGCPTGKHPDWAVDSEVDSKNANACPWCEITRLRAELERARAAALNEGAAELDRGADQAEEYVAARYPGLTGHGSCDMLRQAARTLRDMATPACTCRAEAVHQAGCDTGLGA